MNDDSIDDIISKIQQEIDRYLKEQLKVPNFSNIDVSVFGLTSQELSRMTSEDINDKLLVGNNYILFLQQEINQHKAWERWAVSKLDEVASHFIEKISTSYGFNERVLIAKNNPEICKRLNSIIRHHRMKYDSLYGLCDSLNKILDIIRDYKYLNGKKDKAHGYNSGQ